MITKDEKESILRCAKKHDVSELYLFGSSSEKKGTYNDIDIGVRGVKHFFKFYADLFKSLSKPVDLVDLSKKSLFTKLIEKEGLKIYGKSV